MASRLPTNSVMEKDLLTEVKIWLQAKNYFVIRNYLGAVKIGRGRRRNPNAGMPDLSVVLPNGHLAMIETKVGKNKLSTEQALWQKNLEANHVLYVLAYSLDDVVEKFRAWGF